MAINKQHRQSSASMVILCYSACIPWATLLLDVYTCMHVYDDYSYNDRVNNNNVAVVCRR